MHALEAKTTPFLIVKIKKIVAIWWKDGVDFEGGYPRELMVGPINTSSLMNQWWPSCQLVSSTTRKQNETFSFF